MILRACLLSILVYIVDLCAICFGVTCVSFLKFSSNFTYSKLDAGETRKSM